MDPHLARLQQEIGSALQGWTADDLRWHLPGKWSAAEILEHLYLTYTGTVKGFGRLIETGAPKTSPPTWKHRTQAMIVVGLGYMPGGRKSPPNAQPKGLPPKTVAADIVPKIILMDEVINQSAEKFGTRAKVLDHPILGPFSISQWRKFHLVHGLHHVKQIRSLQIEMKKSKGKRAS